MKHGISVTLLSCLFFLSSHSMDNGEKRLYTEQEYKFYRFTRQIANLLFKHKKITINSKSKSKTKVFIPDNRESGLIKPHYKDQFIIAEGGIGFVCTHNFIPFIIITHWGIWQYTNHDMVQYKPKQRKILEKIGLSIHSKMQTYRTNLMYRNYQIFAAYQIENTAIIPSFSSSFVSKETIQEKHKVWQQMTNRYNKEKSMKKN